MVESKSEIKQYFEGKETEEEEVTVSI